MVPSLFSNKAPILLCEWQNVILGTSSNKILRDSKETLQKDASLLNSWISNSGSRMTNVIILQWWCRCVPFKILSKFRWTESRIFKGRREKSPINIEECYRSSIISSANVPNFCSKIIEFSWLKGTQNLLKINLTRCSRNRGKYMLTWFKWKSGSKWF